MLLALGRRRHCRIDGKSMMPTLYTGDIVIFRPLTSRDEPLHNGCIVVLDHPLKERTLIVKRIHKVLSKGIELRGDNEQASTDSRQFGLVRNAQIKGIVEYVFPGGSNYLWN